MVGKAASLVTKSFHFYNLEKLRNTTRRLDVRQPLLLQSVSSFDPPIYPNFCFSSSMLPSLQNTVSQIRNINGDYYSRTHSLCFLQNPSFIIWIKSISSSSANPNSSSFVVSYLMNSCGLSQDKAIPASKRINFDTSSRPDSVLTLLEGKGFTKPHISKLITCRPDLLLANPGKTLKPKLEFFNSIGLSGLDLAKVLSTSNILARSLDKHIIPTYAFLKTILLSDKNVIATLKRSSWLLRDLEKSMVPNVEILRDRGVPKPNIMTFLMAQPRALQISAVRFKEIVEEVNNLGFDPLQYKFLLAIYSVAGLSKSTWEAKLNVFRRLGWSEDEIRSAFKKNPQYMWTSKKKIKGIMDFFVNQMGYKPSFLAKHPHLFNYSLEKRITPRCRVIRILGSKGLSDNYCLTSVLTMGGKSFLERYVIKFEQEIPELKEFRGQLDMLSITTD